MSNSRPPAGPIDPNVVFKIQKVPVPEVRDGEVLVKSLYLSLDPAMVRGRSTCHGQRRMLTRVQCPKSRSFRVISVAG